MSAPANCLVATGPRFSTLTAWPGAGRAGARSCSRQFGTPPPHRYSSRIHQPTVCHPKNSCDCVASNRGGTTFRHGRHDPSVAGELPRPARTDVCTTHHFPVPRAGGRSRLGSLCIQEGRGQGLGRTAGQAHLCARRFLCSRNAGVTVWVFFLVTPAMRRRALEQCL